MKKTLIIISVLAFAGSASANAGGDAISSMESFYKANRGKVTQGVFVGAVEQQGLSCATNDSTVICSNGNGLTVIGAFTPRLSMYGVVISEGCSELRAAAIHRYKKPTSRKYGLLIWKRGAIVRGFAGKGTLFEDQCALTIREAD